MKYDAVHYEQRDSSGMSVRLTKTAPEPLQAVSTSVYPFYIDPANGELDAGATNVGLVDPYPPEPNPPLESPVPAESTSPMYIDGQRTSVTLDGMAISWQFAQNLLNSGWIGGQMGLIERSMMQSDPRFVGYSAAGKWFGNNLTKAVTEAIEMNTWTAQANYYVGDSWHGFSSSPHSTDAIWAIRTLDKKPLSLLDVSVLKGKVSELLTGNCKDFIKMLMDRANEVLTEQRNNASEDELKYLNA